MTYELQPDKFHLIKELHNEMDFDLLTPAIVEGKITGRIWVNNPEKPSTALVWDEHYSFFLMGDESNQLFNSSLDVLFADIIIPDALSRNYREGWLEVPSRWRKKIEQNEVLPNLFPMHHAREHYAIHQSTGLKWAEKILPGLSLDQIDDEFLKRTDLENLKTVLDMISVRWKSVENFLRWGFGFILSQNTTIVSYCLSLGNGNGRCDIEIETIEGHQRQGYASLLTAAFVDHALTAGYTEIGWDAFAANVPSVQLALKLGFKKKEDHVCYSGRYNAVD
ncbi:MAG: GNAT family N-acetyltransferase [Candidatus Heimdallarchaeota archaeon]